MDAPGFAPAATADARSSPISAPAKAATSPGSISIPPEEARARLEMHRQSIDNIDAALIHMLAERFRHTQSVGELKAKAGLPAADPSREARQIARLRELAANARLDPDFAEKFLAFIIREVIRHHDTIAGRVAPDAPAEGRS
ncbi:chorismate mutase [Acidomonas methanolica]|nr:chorismate mutase [Acidomonas methanolica]